MKQLIFLLLLGGKMRLIQNLLFVTFTIALTGCVMWSSSDVSVTEIVDVDKGPRKLTFLNYTPYMTEMSTALAENGFEILPMPTQKQLLEIQSNTGKLNEHLTRWGITLVTKDSGMECAFTSSNIHHFTLMLIDITNNQVALVLKQEGSDGPCSTVKPVFGTLAKTLSDQWGNRM